MKRYVFSVIGTGVLTVDDEGYELPLRHIAGWVDSECEEYARRYAVQQFKLTNPGIPVALIVVGVIDDSNMKPVEVIP